MIEQTVKSMRVRANALRRDPAGLLDGQCNRMVADELERWAFRLEDDIKDSEKTND